MEEKYNFEIGQEIVIVTLKDGSIPGVVISRRLSSFGKRYIIQLRNGRKKEFMERYMQGV